MNRIMNRTKIARLAAQCIRQRLVIRVVRASLEPEGKHLEGVLLALGRSWTILARLDDSGFFDGFDALRLVDISTIENAFPRRPLLVRGLQRRRAQLPSVPVLDLDSTRKLLSSAQRWFPLVTIDREEVNPGACEIGTILRTSANAYSIRLIDARAEMEKRSRRYRTVDVTRVAFGGRYENTLADAANLDDQHWD
jgi:hypothetical protein